MKFQLTKDGIFPPFEFITNPNYSPEARGTMLTLLAFVEEMPFSLSFIEGLSAKPDPEDLPLEVALAELEESGFISSQIIDNEKLWVLTDCYEILDPENWNIC